MILIRLGEGDFAAALEAHTTARVVDQHLAHCARSERQKVRSLKFLLP
jgi:hypothetical protein